MNINIPDGFEISRIEFLPTRLVDKIEDFKDERDLKKAIKKAKFEPIEAIYTGDYAMSPRVREEVDSKELNDVVRKVSKRFMPIKAKKQAQPNSNTSRRVYGKWYKELYFWVVERFSNECKN